MRKNALSIIAICVFHLALLSNALADELRERMAIQEDVVTLFITQRFSELETLSAQYRDSKSRTSSGLWHLTLFYAGINEAFNIEHRQPLFWRDAERAAKKWATDYPDSPTSHLGYARMLINHGWSVQRSGRPNAMDPLNQKALATYLQQARAYLEQHKETASRDPHWYELMAEIGRAQDWAAPEFSALISEGLEREPHFYQTYFAAFTYYATNSDASEAVEKLARDAVERTKATDGFGLYARIYWFAAQTEYGDRLFSQTLVDWGTMKKGIDDVLKAYPDDWNVNNFALFACLARDQFKTAELTARIGNSPLLQAWGSPAVYQRCKVWAAGERA